MLATCCQGFGEVAQALVTQGSCCGWPFNEALVIVASNHTVSCLSMHRSMEALAEHAFNLALRHQHLWCLTITSVTYG